VLVLFLAASAAPTPLYRVYQARWGFSATTLTAVFAVYVLFLLATVLIFGSLSDHVGRRPVIIIALAVDAVACILFLLAHGVGELFAARALQGAAVGLAASALGAALLDLRPAGSLAPLVTSNGGTVGLALGALGTSVLVQYGPVPAHLVWWLLLGAFLAAILLTAATPEPGTVRPGALASLLPDVSVPRPAQLPHLPNCRRARAPCHRARKQRPREPSQRRHPSNHLQQPCSSPAALPATGQFSLVRRERHYSRKTSLYHGEVETGSGVPGRASSSADTSAAWAAPIRCKIASACRSLASASAVRPAARAHRPRPGRPGR
jgi:MFS family permease